MDEKDTEARARESITFVLILLLSVLFVFSLGYILRTSVPLAVVSSWSMEPTLHVGDIVVVSGSSNYSRGDIVVYESFSGLIVHRIVAYTEGGYITKGDANPYPDSIHPSEKTIKGKVVLVVPYVGTLKLVFEQMLARTRF